MKNKVEVLTFRADPQINRMVREIAADTGQSVSATLERLLSFSLYPIVGEEMIADARKTAETDPLGAVGEVVRVAKATAGMREKTEEHAKRVRFNSELASKMLGILTGKLTPAQMSRYWDELDAAVNQKQAVGN